MRRAFVITLEVDGNQPDQQLAVDLQDELVDAGFTVVQVNPYGGDAETVKQPQGFGASFPSFFKPSL